MFVLESRLPGACPGREIVRSEDVFTNVCNTSDMSKLLKMMNTYTIMLKAEWERGLNDGRDARKDTYEM